ncbi:cilia- and flagella-associated protein 206 isoform X2 [Alligator mississippiensis]|nr:cilia- and flagella-associated protein 206 isoform X2 [Alligator mississippiensis]XP_019352441.1 cilia- and flagella-associated protein 206 isoform X2 [Alligator mississippiensis]
MAHAEAESVIKNIIREIGQECAIKGQTVPETLVAFMVKAVVLDPKNDFNVDRTLTKNDVQKLIKLCIDRLLDTTNPSLDTIKMQVFFDMNYINRVELLNEQHHIVESRLASVTREITDSRARTREELESVYRKIVSYVLLRSGLGSPTDIKAVREATAALQSVFPQTEMGVFLSLSKKDKERQLKELTMTVTGIRLFNKDTGKGGESIDDVPAILNEAIPAATQSIDAELHASQQMAHRYTALLESVHENLQGNIQLGSTMLKEALFNVRQHEAFLCIILSDVITCAQEVEMMQKQFAAQMEHLKSIVQAKTAVPTSQVFPVFIALANLWTSFQDEIILLSFLTNIAVNLHQFLGTHLQLFPDEMMESHLEGVTVKSDQQRIEETMGIKVDVSDFKEQEWLFPETTANFDQLQIQYHGFCAHTFAVKDGLLLPGSPTIGILKHKEKFYAFNSKESAYIFAQNPDKFIQLIIEKAKENAELIQLLELHHQFESLAPYTQVRSGDKHLLKPITKCDSSTQTDTHILPPTIVKSYEWNEWELRRKVIKLANLRRTLTHSVQTNLSHMRRENFSQVYLLKDFSTQTKCDSSSNVPKPQIFLAGLRGGSSPTTHMIKMDLTRAVDET